MKRPLQLGSTDVDVRRSARSLCRHHLHLCPQKCLHNCLVSPFLAYAVILYFGCPYPSPYSRKGARCRTTLVHGDVLIWFLKLLADGFVTSGQSSGGSAYSVCLLARHTWWGGIVGHPQYANYWAPLTRKRHTMPHSAQSQHTNYWAPRTRKRHQQEHRPQRPTESSDPTQHAKGRTGDRPGPRKGATTRRNVTQGGEIVGQG